MSVQFSVTDWTEEFNLVGCPERDLAKAVIKYYFDIEQVAVSDRVKHYPLDDQAHSQEEKAKKFQLMNKIIWSTVLIKIGAVDLGSNQKLGKVIYSVPNKFTHANKTEDFKAYMFEFNNGELQAEINFTIEFY